MRLFLIFFCSISFLFSQQNNTVLDKQATIDSCWAAYKSNNLTKFKHYNVKLYHLYKTSQDTALLARYYRYTALAHKLQSNTDSTLYYYKQSVVVHKQLKDSLSVGRRLLSIALLQKNAKDFIGSEISVVEALEYLEPLKAYRRIEIAFNILGLVSEELNQIDTAIQYYYKALAVGKLHPGVSEQYYVLNNLGLLYARQGKHKKAISYCKKGLAADSIKQIHPRQYTLLLENLAISNYELGNKKKVLQQYQEVLALRKKHGFTNEICGSYLNLAAYYNQEREFILAKEHAQKALTYAKKTHNNYTLSKSLRMLSVLSTPKQAEKYLNQHIQLSDSLLFKERAIKNQFAKIRYETTKKEKENLSLKNKNQLQKVEIGLQKQQIFISWLIIGAIVLALGYTYLYFTTRRKKLLFQAQLDKLTARENERQDIAKSLHDEIAGDLRMLHQKLKNNLMHNEALRLDAVKESVRTLSHDLSSVNFNKVSFKEQIVSLVSDYFDSNFTIKVKGLAEDEAAWAATNATIKRLLYLCSREGVQNCNKYAQATNLYLNFQLNKKNVFLDIIDDGVGFDNTKTKKGIGLQNLKERVEDLGGVFIVSSATNKGSEIHIQIPLPK